MSLFLFLCELGKTTDTPQTMVLFESGCCLKGHFDLHLISLFALYLQLSFAMLIFLLLNSCPGLTLSQTVLYEVIDCTLTHAIPLRRRFRSQDSSHLAVHSLKVLNICYTPPFSPPPPCQSAHFPHTTLSPHLQLFLFLSPHSTCSNHPCSFTTFPLFSPSLSSPLTPHFLSSSPLLSHPLSLPPSLSHLLPYS